MDFITIISIIGAIASIFGCFYSIIKKPNKIWNIASIVLLVICCCIITNQNSKLKRIEQISKSAMSLSTKRYGYTGYSCGGHIQAILAFLEQNKDTYPDRYKDAIIAYNRYEESKDNSLQSVYNECHLADKLNGLVMGITVLNSDK
jgi:hypothetical protein